jgi:hypothetical protein
MSLPKLENIEPAFLTTDATRSTSSDQYDELLAWQALAVPAAGAGTGFVIDIHSHYGIQSQLVTSLEVYFFMTSVTPLASSSCDR